MKYVILSVLLLTSCSHEPKLKKHDCGILMFDDFGIEAAQIKVVEVSKQNYLVDGYSINITYNIHTPFKNKILPIELVDKFVQKNDCN